MKKPSLNHRYRLIWSRIQHAWVAVAEHVKSDGKTTIVRDNAATESAFKSTACFGLTKKTQLALIVASALFGASQNVYAQWTDLTIQSGQATTQQQGNHLDVNVSTASVVGTASSLDIAANQSVNVRFAQGGGNGLFRSTGNSATNIMGGLTSNGNLFLINQNGVLFGQGAQVNVGGLVASTMNINDADFLSGHYQFNANGSNGNVTNLGTLKVSDGGYLVLLGKHVTNNGTLTANNGSVVMGAADSAILDFYGNGLVKANLSGDALEAVVTQSGNIQADGGAVQLTTNSRSSAVNVSGLVQANSLVERNGIISLSGGDNAKVAVSGTLMAAGNKVGTTGGNIEVIGEQVALLGEAQLDASGEAGGGQVLVGGDFQGNNKTVYNARTNYVGQNASINVDAKQTGDAGTAIVWADQTTRYYGDISAKGGAAFGDGGFVEVSGKQHLDFIGSVDVSAQYGLGGNVLLDPENIILNNSAQPAPLDVAGPDVAFGAAPNPGTMTIQINDVRGFSELHLQATNDITVEDTLSMYTNNSIILEANNDINVNAEISTRGTGSIDLIADNNVNLDGRLNSYGTGDITVTADNDSSGAGDVTVNQRIYSRGNINLNGFNVQGATTAGYVQTQALPGQPKGNIAINATNDINLAGALNTYGRNGAAAANGEHAGDVNLTAGGGIATANITAYGGRGGTGNTNGGNAGNITVNSTGAGDINVGNVNARNGRASSTGLGGATGTIKINNASGNIDTKNLAAYGDTNGNGGNIDIDAASGDITVTGYAYTQGGGTAAGSTLSGRDGGDIDLNASGDVTVTGRIYAQGAAANTANTAIGGNGGNVIVKGNNLTFGNVIYSYGNTGRGIDQAGGNAGSIDLNATGAITADNTINANGGSGATGSDSNAGSTAAVSIVSTGIGDITTGSVNARNGAARGMGLGGATSSITINNAAGNINTKTLNVSGNASGNGGNIDVDATAGDITVTGVAYAQGGTTAADSTASGGNGGNVDLDASGDVTVTNRIYTQGGGVGNGNTAAGGYGGDINVTGTNLNFNNVIYSYGGNARGLDQAGGDGGSVSLNATGAIATKNVYSYGASGGTGVGSNAEGGDAGTITIASTGAGDISTLTVNARNGAARGTGVGGGTGSINISNTSGNISTRNLDAYGNTNGHGGDITVTAATGDVTVTGRVYSYGGGVASGHTLAGRYAGGINISGVNRTITGTVNANGNTARGTDQPGGRAGVVTITGTGTLNTAAVSARTGRATGTGAGGNTGSITLSGSTITATSTLDTRGNSNGAGGNINLTSTTGDTNVKAVYASGGGAIAGNTGNVGGDITINSAGALTAANVYVQGSSGNGANNNGGDAGEITVNAAGAITTARVYAYGGNGGGNNALTNAAAGGNAGNVTLNSTAAGDITLTQDINVRTGFSRGSGSGAAAGSINITNTSGNITTKNVRAEGQNHGNGSNVTLDAGTAGDVTVTGVIYTYGDTNPTATNIAGTQAGDITVKGANTTVTSTINANGGRSKGAGQAGGNAGDVTIESAGVISTKAVAASGGNAGVGSDAVGGDGGDIRLSSTGAGDITTTNITARTGYSRGSATALGAGSVDIQNTDGVLTTGNISTRGQRRGVGGDIKAVTTGGDISVGTVDARASNLPASDGGDVTLATTTGDATVTNILTGGRWLVYSGDPRQDTVVAFKSSADFKQYNTNYGSALLDTGNGFVYRYAPTIMTSLTGAAIKPYDGNTTASITGITMNPTGGEIDGDVINISALTSATYDNKNVGTGKAMTSNPLTAISGSNGTTTVYGYQVDAATGNIGSITESPLSIAEGQAEAAASNPRNTAGLGGPVDVTNQQQFLAVFDVDATAAGGDIDPNAETCDTNADKKLNNPNTSLMLNFGMNLPEGVKKTCISG